MRGSQHDYDIHEFSIGPNGLSVGKAFRSVSGILSGAMTNLALLPSGASGFDGMLPTP